MSLNAVREAVEAAIDERRDELEHADLERALEDAGVPYRLESGALLLFTFFMIFDPMTAPTACPASCTTKAIAIPASHHRAIVMSQVESISSRPRAP